MGVSSSKINNCAASLCVGIAVNLDLWEALTLTSLLGGADTVIPTRLVGDADTVIPTRLVGGADTVIPTRLVGGADTD